MVMPLLQKTLALLIAAMAILPVAHCRAGNCSPDSTGVDISQGTTVGSLSDGNALGETFYAADTLIASITVWRAALQDTNVYGLHLFITGTDSTGSPRSTLLLLDGPTVYNPYGDGVHPVPFVFVFDPPFALPNRGLYYLAIQANPCYGVVSLYDTKADLYQQGNLWENGRTIFGGCRLRDFPTPYSGDLCFSVVSCKNGTTATRGATWGHVKVIYR